jgi:hypothetical protein
MTLTDYRFRSMVGRAHPSRSFGDLLYNMEASFSPISTGRLKCELLVLEMLWHGLKSLCAQNPRYHLLIDASEDTRVQEPEGSAS